ncbi:MAG: hypothetical protein PHF63_00345 [Herbinix sp.]|nr:hypothetical protein [Herbinix sp.]
MVQDNAKIVSTVAVLGGLELKVHLRLTSTPPNGNGEFSRPFPFIKYGNNFYINLQSFFTLEKRSKERSLDDSIMIDSNNLGVMVRTLNIISNNLIRGSVFGYDTKNNLSLPKKSIEASTYIVYHMNTGKCIKILPTIIYDSANIGYEGIRICFNSDSNYIDTFVNDFHTLVLYISKLDPFVYSHQLLDLYLSHMSGKNITGYNRPSYNSNNNPFNK